MLRDQLFDFLKTRGIGELQIGQDRERVISLLGPPTDFSVQNEPEIIKWHSLECAFDYSRLSFVSIRLEEDPQIRLPVSLREVESSLRGLGSNLLIAMSREQPSLNITPIRGLTFEDQAGFQIGPFWVLVIAEGRPYLLSTKASQDEVNDWRGASNNE